MRYLLPVYVLLLVLCLAINPFSMCEPIVPQPPAPLPEQPVLSMSQEQAVSFIEECMASHQAYVDQPQYCNEWTGDVERHKELIEQYQQVIMVLEEE